MKRISIIISALALVFGMLQCKKNNDITTPSDGNTVRITLDIDDGSKVIVTPPSVAFSENDTIYVGYDGKYVGKIVHNGTCFTGNISVTQDGDQPLYFYFLGNKTPSNINGESSGVLTPGTTTSLSVNITDQGNYPHLPVISMGVSNENYSSGTTTYTSRLYNKCSLMKFNVTTSSTAQICITGMNNKVTLDFSKPTETGTGLEGGTTNNGFSYSKDGDGLIKMSAKDNDNVTWAIVLPQGALTAGGEYSAYTNDYKGVRPAISAIESNKFYDSGINFTINTQTGMLLGEFTINESGDIIHFSKGNLQAIGSNSSKETTWTWKFADNQYTRIGNAAANTSINGSMSVSANGTVDLFGWNGESSSLVNYGINNSQVSDDYGSSTSESLKNDWGNLAISNGGNVANSGWRTLTKDEWNYLGNTRTNALSKYGYGTVCTMHGVIILPDSFIDPLTNEKSGSTSFVGKAGESIGWADNVYSDANHWGPMEAAGAVFLPTAGFRNQTNVDHVEDFGYYWTSSPSTQGAKYASALYFHGGDSWSTFEILETFTLRYNGKSVRLVR